jgi:hypothetical protein
MRLATRFPGSARFLRYAAAGAAVIATALALQACSTPERLDSLPPERSAEAIVIDTPNARFYPGTHGHAMFEEGLAAAKREMAYLGLTDPSQLPPANYLAISGGGPDGAFGAGLLIGWGETGTRPEFKLVTGVSTGALIAPFAFLGKDYDEALSTIYTTITEEDVFVDRDFTAVFFDDALKDTSPLFHLIEGYVNEQMMADIAREYEQGRLLLIGSTNLDARRPVIWNIGAIAASGDPRGIDLIRKILLASAAMPLAFPPVMIDVELDGKAYQEMHVDGGAVAQLFLYPPSVGEEIKEYEAETGLTRERHAYLIRNSKLLPTWSTVDRQTLSIGGQAVSTMIYISGVNDLYRAYFVTQTDGVDYNLAYIGADFEGPQSDAMFDPAYMKALYEYGYQLGRAGYEWQKTPPYLKAQ